MDRKIRVCKKCLLREMDEAGYFQNMYEYIARMDEEERTSKEEYEERLAACKTCENLLSGMCRICGCYVEMRAAQKVRHCPGIHPKW
ncbi:MAG: DUF6171 family protein [Fusicatenibacter sp.]|nr:DUF6171 family protein [Lachnospiraceae bacterium]MDY2937767.1 DUF6171 family protein [Fusicatenibacter sp.]